MSSVPVSARDVQELRRATGAGMMDAKQALVRSGGDFEAATRLLREEGKATAQRRADRESSQGAVAMVVDPPVGAIVELRCETDFVAKSSEFVGLVEDLAARVAAEGPSAVDSVSEEVETLATTFKENISIGRVVRFDSGEHPDQETVVDGYLHLQSDRGVNAVLVEVAGGTRTLAHDVAVHIAFSRPSYLKREDVPEQDVEAERSTLEAAARHEGRPEAALSKVVEGRLTAWYKERVLEEQPFVRDEKQTVAQLLGTAKILRFSQVVVGS